MRVAVLSDLHLEFETPGRAPAPTAAVQDAMSAAEGAACVDADLIVLAGDIHTKGRGPGWAAKAFPATPVVMLGGNHEAFGDSLYASIAKNRKAAAAQGLLADGTPHVTWLERETWSWTSPAGERVRVIGATLWTDFHLFGADQRERAVRLCAEGLNDYWHIRIPGDGLDHGTTRRFSPADAARIHALSVAFLKRELAQPFDGLTIVATHHAPSRQSLADEFREDVYSAAYVSDLGAIIEEFQPSLWVHGHTHVSFDYEIGATRVVCNPRGYWPDELNPGFNWAKTVDLSPRPRLRLG